MIKLFPNTGDLIIFDTHGIHSYYKKEGLTRSVFTIAIDPIFNQQQVGIHKKNHNARICKISNYGLYIE